MIKREGLRGTAASAPFSLFREVPAEQENVDLSSVYRAVSQGQRSLVDQKQNVNRECDAGTFCGVSAVPAVSEIAVGAQTISSGTNSVPRPWKSAADELPNSS